MVRITKPSEAEVRAIVERERGKALSYAPVGMTRGEPPPGFLINQARVELGRGEAAFARAREAVRGWAMYDLGWTQLWPARPPVEEGSTFATVVQAYATWSVNVARVVYAIEEPRRAGFAIGTLPHHLEAGEERFLVEWTEDDRVWFDLLAYTSLRHWAGKAASPLALRLLRRFAREASEAVKENIHHRDTEAHRETRR